MSPLGSTELGRADQLLDEGDMAGAETWHRILNAIERLQAKAPRDERLRGQGAHYLPMKWHDQRQKERDCEQQRRGNNDGRGRQTHETAQQHCRLHV